MIIKKIIGFCKRSGNLHLYEGKECQWISDGSAIFPLFNLPQFDTETICRAFDIPEKKAAKMHLKYDYHLPTTLCFEDDTPDEVPCEIGDELFGGLLPITTPEGLMFIQRQYLLPFADTDDAMLYIFRRYGANAAPYFAVKIGFALQALILPFDCVNERFVKRLESVYEQCKIALFNKSGAGAVEGEGDGSDG